MKGTKEIQQAIHCPLSCLLQDNIMKGRLAFWKAILRKISSLNLSKYGS